MIQSAGTIGVRVRVNNLDSNTVSFIVTPRPGSGGMPSISIIAPSVINSPGINIGVMLGSGAPATLAGTLSMAFAPNAAALPTTGYRDPAQAFASGGTSINFTVQQGQTTAVLPNAGALNIGTVAGTLTITMVALTQGGQNVLPNPPPSSVITIFRIAPVITDNSVRIVNTSNGFNVELQGYSTPRDLERASFQFTFATNALPQGETVFNVDLRNAALTWFNSASGRNNGSRFLLTVPFDVSGDANLVRSVAVTVVNSVGSSTITGSRP